MEKNYQVVFAAPKVAQIEEASMPTINDDQVLIQTQVSQISTGTELTMLEHEVDEDSLWATERTNYPIYPGYSNVGVIVKVGANVDPSCIGKRVLTFERHVKYYRASYQGLVFLPDNVDSDDAVFASMAQITLGSIRVAGILPGDAVVVYGAGLIGQFVARFAKIAGAIKVFVVDLSDFRLNHLPDDPCFIKVNPTKVDVVEFIKEHNNGELVRFLFETTGNQKLIASQANCLARRGKLIITSSPKGKSLIDFDYINTLGIVIIGAHNWAVHTPVATPDDPWTRPREVQYYVELLEKEQMSVKSMVSHKANYKDAADMYNMLMEDRSVAMAVHLYWEDEK